MHFSLNWDFSKQWENGGKFRILRILRLFAKLRIVKTNIEKGGKFDFETPLFVGDHIDCVF